MLTFLGALLISSAVLVITAAPRIDRTRTASWFDLLPHMTVSKKSSGRQQQTAAHRKRRTRR
ncbi:hypothetical protein E3T37_03540 [Cryobacterium sp. TMT2-10]|uniref:hypothetical protein n=1 Tax=Cryobacterium sp. TMT2-10 TaxID=1259244 RepID=UPI00106CE1EC|nr:hypothetical protein [Cryobacterium sp. TMT2-10]TFD41738.1 hypothetical protein E3T37_03540 [Cryobacterium sp. TMT2-10]